MDETGSIFTAKDLERLAEHGISQEEASSQIAYLRDGRSYLQLEGSGSIEYGIMRIKQDEMPYYLDLWDRYRYDPQHRITKFVPASGAATRMFQHLYELLDAGAKSQEELSEEQRYFFEHIEEFAFFGELSESCLRNEWSTVAKLLEGGRYDLVAKSLLTERGLNYGHLPKGLVPFHKYPGKYIRTAATEHLAEGALYTKNSNGVVHLHYTVSPEHIDFFRQHLERATPRIEGDYGVIIESSFSTQNCSSDTLALDEEGMPFRTEEGDLLFRPGGHGALIDNLADLESDVIFIKNIDNVTMEHLKSNTILYKKLLGGVLLSVQERIFGYLRQLERGKCSHSQLEEMVDFLHKVLCIQLPQIDLLGDKELAERIQQKLNRPIRVCGMVRNDGEPGGGPYIVREADGSTSLQIVEASQIDKSSERDASILAASSYFNPVDIVCSPYDFKGQHFHLQDYVNKRTAFVATKSQNGKQLQALERPGLWNGAMHHWNTIFVEVPSDTFTPVKTVTDLLRQEHREVDDLD